MPLYLWGTALARCDRRLDDALAHAARAVELKPAQAGYRDTLAEVHFRRGERQEAIALAQRNLEAEPGNEHFQRQWRRFADPPAAVDAGAAED